MLLRLVVAELRNRPGRAAFLVGGYSLGVAVMVVLLAVGEAMVEQARDRSLVGGGDLVIVPAGISAEMLKAGGSTSLFLGLDRARFIQRQILESPRAREEMGITAASPILDDWLVTITRGGQSFTALASGEIPSRARAMGAAPRLLAGRWEDSDADRRWSAPAPGELYDEIDAFHLPYGSAVGDSTWAEWHYFNVVLDQDRWIYLTFMVAGRVGTPGEWGGRVLLTVHEPGAGHRSRSRDVPSPSILLDTLAADVVFAEDAYVRQRDGVYHVFARLGIEVLDLAIRPSPNRLFPPTELGGEGLVSGYVVPALHATASGRVCLERSGAAAAACEEVVAATAYHDHNWGVWRDVAWEWGAASDDEMSLLYGAVRASELPDQGLFAYLVDRQGVRGIFRPPSIEFPEIEEVSIGGRLLRVPRRIEFEDRRRGLHVEIEVGERQVTDLEREEGRYFVQMRGVATVTQPGSAPRRLPGFFETYVDDP